MILRSGRSQKLGAYFDRVKRGFIEITWHLMREMSFHVSRKGYSKLKSYLQKFSNEEQQGTKNTWFTIENKLNCRSHNK